MKRAYFNAVKIISIHQGVVSVRLMEQYEENGHMTENIVSELCTDIDTLTGALKYLSASIYPQLKNASEDGPNNTNTNYSEIDKSNLKDDDQLVSVKISTKFARD